MMEGGGEGVVAVVRWLSDAGLAVGLLSAQPLRPIVERVLRESNARASSRPVRPEQRASQTFPERERQHAICPEPYASTYQVTHCGVGASSPARWHTEFPPQRREPSPALGNFEVGRTGSPAHSNVYKCRADKDSGWQHRPQHDRDVDAFVSSLRKYPSVTERTTSTELLERLLKTSHTRTLSPKETPPPSKKRRHHWDKPQSLAPLSLYANVHRDRGHKNPGQAQSDPRQKTYGPEKYPLPSPMRHLARKGKSYGVQAQSNPRQKTYGPEKYPLPGPVSITAFDYLNSGKSSPKIKEKKMDKRHAKNAFREHREKRPVTAFPVCPVLRKRFEKHLKECHPATSKDLQVEFANRDTCRKCLQKKPCLCEAGKGPKGPSNKKEQEKRLLEDAIFTWLKDIPIYPNEKPHDKFIRDAIVKKLAETLSGMPDSQLAIEGKKEIEKALKKMPMWYPTDQREREHFINMITDNLIQKLESVKEMKSFNEAAEEFLDEITFTKEIDREQVMSNIITELNKIALNRPEDDTTYRDLLKLKAFELLDQLPIKTFGSKYEYLNELSDKLAEHLVNPHLDPEIKQTIKEDIKDILDHSHAYIKNRDKVEESLRKLVADIVIKGMDDDKAESLIRCLLDRNVSDDKIEGIKSQILALADKVQPTHSKLSQKTKQMIKDYVRDMIDMSDVQIKNRPKIEEGLRKIVHDAASKGMDDDKAVDLIKSLLKGKVPEDKHDDFIDQILELINQLQPIQLDQGTRDMLKGDIRDILALSGATIKDREEVEKSLLKIVNDLVTKAVDENEAVGLIKTILKGKVPEHKHEPITNKILELANQVNPLDMETKQMIKGDIRDILDTSGAKSMDRDKIEKTLNTIIHDVATTGMDEGKAKALIKSTLKGKVPEDQFNDITDQILELANQVKPIQVQPLDKETKQMIKGDIHDILNISGPNIKDRETIEKTLNTIAHDIATTGMDEDKAEDLIKSVLKGKVSEDKYDDIKDQILSLANQVKPSQTQPVDNETKQIIKGDIRDILDTTDAPIKNREKIEKTLNTIVHDVVSKGLDEDKAEAMVKSLLKGKVSEDKLDEISDQILSLVSQVKPIQVQPLDKETKQMIKDDIHDVLDISGAKIKDREKIEKSLNKIVHDIATKRIDEDKVEAMVKSLLKGKVSEDKHDEIIDQILSLANQVKPPEVQPLDKETQQMIKGDIREVLDLSGAKPKDREKIEKTLNAIVHDVATTGMDESKAEAMIKSLLKGKVSEDKQDDIIDQVLSLANQVKPPEVQPLDKETKQMIKGDIREVLDLSGAKPKDREKIEKTLNAIVHDVATTGMDESKAEAMIKSLLKGKVSEDKQDDIIDQVLSLANQVKPPEVQPLDKETQQMIKGDIREVLDLSGAKPKDREKIEKTLNAIVHDIATTSMDESKAEAMIKSLLKGKVSEDKHDDIIDQVLSLANQVKPPEVQPLDKETQQIIKGDIREVLDLSGAKPKDREKIEKTLNAIVHDVATTGMDESKAEAMIKSLLKGKVSEDKQDDIIDQVLTLANQVKPPEVQPLDKETKQMIKGDIREVLDLSGAKIKDRETIEKTLNTIVHDIATTGLDEGKAEAMIKSLLKGKVSEDKHDDIIDQVLSLANQVKPREVQPLDKETQQMIKGDIREVLDLSGAKPKDREKIEKTLNTIVHDVATRGMDESKAKAMIKSLLKGKVSEEKHDEIIDQVLSLANQLKPIQVQPLDKETKQMVKDDIHDVLDISGAKIKDREKIEKSLNKIVHDVATKGIDEDKVEAMVKSLLRGKVSEDKHDEIIDQVLSLANQVKPIQVQPLDKETKQMVKDDIHDVLDISGAKIKDREKIEKSLNKIVHDVATKGIDEDEVEAMVKSLLKGKVPADKQDDIIDQVLSLANQVKPSSSKPLDLETKQTMKKNITDILDDSKSHIKNRNQVEEDVRHLISSMLSKSIGKDEAKSRLKRILKGKVSDDEVEDISSKFLELANKMDPKFQEALKNDITDILLETDAPLKNRSKVEESLRDILSDIVMRGMDKSKAQNYILSALKGNVSDSQAKEISRKILAAAEQRSLSHSQDSISSGPIASSTQNDEKIYYDQVYGSTRDWLKNMNIALKDGQIDKVAEAIANETLDRQKYLQLNPGVKISQKKESELLKEQIYKALNKLVDKKTVQSIMTNADDLMRSLKEIPPLQDSSKDLVQDSMEFVQENLEGALLNWLRGSPIYQSRYRNNKVSQEQMMSKLAKTIAAVLSSPAMTKPGVNLDEALLKEIIKQLEELPLEPQFKSKDYIQQLGGHLLDYLKSLQLFQDISARGSLKDSHRTNTSLMPTTNHLNDIVNDWCVALPLPNTDESFRIQQDLANKIVLKIGEMNMNQDIFNDDSLYEEVLQDFIDQQANSLEISQYVTEDHKRVLIEQIKELKQKVQDDMVGRAYKQQLRDTVSNTLPSILSPTVDDLASFELMKENLADAFINLNYSGEDEEVRAKYKRKIIDEVNKYVNDYLRRCPAPPVNAKKLNEDLYKALITVPVPGDESMRSEVETVRMKEVINDWLKTIPMNKQSKAELLRTNKIITLLAQKLQELETEFHPEFEATAVEEIVTYLKKLPLKNKNNLDVMAKKLVEKIKNTAESRSFVEGTRSNLADDCLCKGLPVPPLPARASNQSCVSFIPPCGLSKEDQELLQKIRERSLLCPTATQLRNRKDAAVNPPPSDHGSQTEMSCQSKCCQHAEKSEPCPRFFTPKTKRVPVRPCTSTGSQADVSPFVLVKEYYWDSPSGNKVELATQTPVEESSRTCIPSSVSPAGVCRSRECITRRTIRPRTHLDASSCRRATPRRQFTSACPNEYFSRPKPHNCLKSRPCQERDYLRSQCRRVGANRPRGKPSCLSCQAPTRMCPDCFPMNVCPHPTCLYFK